MTKNTSKILIAAIAGIMIAGTLAVALPTAVFAKDSSSGGQSANGGIGGAGGAGGVGGAGGINIGKESVQKNNANGGDANGGDGGDANGGHASCSIYVKRC